MNATNFPKKLAEEKVMMKCQKETVKLLSSRNLWREEERERERERFFMQLTQQKTLKNLINLHIHTSAPFGLQLLSNQCIKMLGCKVTSLLCGTDDDDALDDDMLQMS
jgi:hypothetical protein